MRKGDDCYKVSARRFQCEKVMTLTWLPHIGFERGQSEWPLSRIVALEQKGDYSYALLEHRCEKVMTVTGLPHIGFNAKR